MGIKNLNQYLLDNCCQVPPNNALCCVKPSPSTSISKQELSVLRNRTVVVDTSIYLYKFLIQDTLIENFYYMISLFREYEITPLFVFDGKPPPEKRALLMKRRQLRKTAEQKLADTDWSDMTVESVAKMKQLKKQCTRLCDQDIQQVKQLMRAYGVAFYDAPGEADQVCAYLVLSGKAWACISDDMDMFLYGCPRVLRHLSLMHGTVLVYETEQILNDIRMTLDTFRQIMVLSGTDYNIHQPLHLKEVLQLYHEYSNLANKTGTFYEWVSEATCKVSAATCKVSEATCKVSETTVLHHKHVDLSDVCAMFCLPSQWPELDTLVINKRTPDRAILRNITRTDGFIYVE